MNNYYHRALFHISAARAAQFPKDGSAEVAFAGRSNAGKSSALNTLCQNKNLARTSKTPGRTQLVNFFNLDDQRRLVDLPGYGYAKVPLAVRMGWQKLMENYLSERPSLRGLVIIMDIRHPLTDIDWRMINWCLHYKKSVHILLTKSDKLSRGAAANALQQVRRTLKSEAPTATVQMFSSLNKVGVDELEAVLNDWLELKSVPESSTT
ncbi:MAG: YihA family ribosome biogenesis GTP-binding protein [Gammaproteobacteria bacterium]|jgi:GTP-binding protein|nr:YihA family ribosome biogenesis GTP-binding protein [Gammaproteobacteria bacterium]HEX5635990.1 ribosome biogenesis GTP-binding protein YihA/YsxC [Gammaproteobacteria bacterium]